VSYFGRKTKNQSSRGEATTFLNPYFYFYF